MIKGKQFVDLLNSDCFVNKAILERLRKWKRVRFTEVCPIGLGSTTLMTLAKRW